MEIRRLPYFRSVVEAGGLSRAAKVLHITPGALSKAITQLETDLDQSLFVRVGRNLELTDDGRRLYAASGRVVDEYTQLLSTMTKKQDKGVETLRIASFEPFTTHTLGAMIESDLRDVHLRVVEAGPHDVTGAVVSGDVDLGISYVPVLHPDLHFRPVTKIEFGIFGRLGAFSNAAFDMLPFTVPITVVSGAAIDVLGVDSWPVSMPRYVKYRLTSMESALELVRRGRAVIFLPTFIAGLHNQTVKAKLRFERIPNPPKMKAVRQTVYTIVRHEHAKGMWSKRLSRAVKNAVAAGTDAL